MQDFSGPYFHVFSPITKKGDQKNSNFHARDTSTEVVKQKVK